MTIIKLNVDAYTTLPPLEISKNEADGDISIGGKKYNVRVLSDSDKSKQMMGKLAELTDAGKDISQIEFIAALTDLPADKIKEERVKIIFETIELANSTNIDAKAPPETFVFQESNEFIERMKTKLALVESNLEKERTNVDVLERKVAELALKTFIGPIAAAATNLQLNSALEDLKKRKLEYLTVLTEIYQGHSSRLKNKEEFLLHMIITAIDVGHLGYLKSFLGDQGETSGGELRLLYFSMLANRPEAIDLIISRGIDPNIIGNCGRGILEIACLRGERSEEAIRALIKGGAKVDLQGKHVPIHEAFMTEISTKTAQFLLDHLDNINLRNEEGDSLLYSAIVDEAFNHRMDLINLLLKNKIDPNIQDKRGRAPLHHAIVYSTHSKNSLKLVRTLLAHGALADLRDIDSQTPLHLAAEYQRPDLILELLKSGAKPRLKDSEGKTALHKSVVRFEPSKKALEALVKAGADINAQDAQGNTPLHLAVYYGSKESVAWLMEHGANPMIRNKEGKLPGENFLFYIDKYSHEIRELLSRPPKL